MGGTPHGDANVNENPGWEIVSPVTEQTKQQTGVEKLVLHPVPAEHFQVNIVMFIFPLNHL